MKNYVKRPVVIQAMQLTNESIQSVLEWIRESGTQANWVSGNDIEIETLEGNMLTREGSYVIRGVRGEFYGCEKSIFEETYEEIL